MKIFIRKSISRKLNTAQYENISISCELEAEFDVNDEKELDKAQSEITNRILKDYKNTEKEVMKELGLEEKRAFVPIDSSQEKNNLQKLSDDIESEIFG